MELLINLGDPLLKAALDGIRDLFCLRGGNLPDDDKFISGNLALTSQKWRAIKARLIDSGHISLNGSKIECPLALAAYVEAASLMEQRRQAGIRSGHARKVQRDGGVMLESDKAKHRGASDQIGSHSNKFNSLDSSTVPPPLKRQRETRRIESGGVGACSISDALQQPNAPAIARTLMKR